MQLSPPDPKSIRDHLQKVLGSERFVRSPQMTQFLRLIVEKQLLGEDLKERTIGEALFRKAADWNTDDDSTVRTYANRLRDRLRIFYENEGRDEPLRIEIPKGSYVPRFNFLEPAEPPASPAAVSKSAGETRANRFPLGTKIRAWLGLVAAVAALTFLGALIVESRNRVPRTIAVSQPLTRDGGQKGGQLFCDGINVYFTQEVPGGKMMLSSIPVEGGNVATLTFPFHRPPDILALERSGSTGFVKNGPEFLLRGPDARGVTRFWNWTPNPEPEPREPSGENTFRISDSVQVDVAGGQLRIREKSRGDRLVSVPGIVGHLSWQQDRRLLRFTVADFGQGSTAIWEMHGLDGKPAPVKDYPENAFEGRWNANADVFTFLSTGSGHPGMDISDVWMDDERSLASQHPAIKRLTFGTIAYSSHVATPDASHVFAIGSAERSELVAYDAARKAWSPYMDGLSAFETDFSRDGQWIAYVHYTDRTLWKVRADGSGRIQLTFPPFQAIQPQWSPDGRRIAVMGQRPGGRHLIYLISSNGAGQPEALIPGDQDQGVPTWSADGSKIVFGELSTEKPHSDMRLHMVEVETRRIWTIPGSAGLWTSRWSPDGRWIAALTADSKELVLYDVGTAQFRSLGRFSYIENPVWALDSKNIYYKTSVDDQEGNRNWLLRRLDIAKLRVTSAADVTDIGSCHTSWFGLTPAGTPLALRCIRASDLYSISVPR